MMHRAVVFLIVLLFPVLAHAQLEMTDELREVHTYVYRLKFEKATEQLNLIESAHPDQLTPSYLRFSIFFLKHFVDDDPEGYVSDKKEMEKLIEHFRSEGDKGSPFYYLYLGEMHLQLAALDAKTGSTWSAGQKAMRGLSALRAGRKKHPGFVPMLAGEGVLNVAIGSLPNNYRFVASILGYSGEVDKGLEQLRQSVERTRGGSFSYLNEKHVFLYGYILHQLQPDQLQDLRDLDVDPSGNALLAFLQAKVLHEQGEVDELIQLLHTARSIPGSHPFPYLDYLLGRAKLSRGDLDANIFFLNYLRENKGKSYVKSSLRYLYWHYLLRNDPIRAAHYRDRIREEGATAMGADLEALRELEVGSMNRNLLLARLAFDAGRLQESLEHLGESEEEICLSDADRLEYRYRQGRIYQAMGRQAEAITAFSLAAEINPEPMHFSRVNAELQLGVLKEKFHPAQAKQHYNNVLNMDDYPWSEGTQQKAKAGLERLAG